MPTNRERPRQHSQRSGPRRSGSYISATSERERLYPPPRGGSRRARETSASPTAGGFRVRPSTDATGDFLDYGATGRARASPPSARTLPSGEREGALKVDLKKVAYRLCIPLRSLLDHFQNDPSSEPHINLRDGVKLQLQVPNAPEEYPDAYETHPHSPNDSIDPAPSPLSGGGRDDTELASVQGLEAKRGTTVMVVHSACESVDGATPVAGARHMRSQDFFSAASLHSDDKSGNAMIDIDDDDEDLPHMAYLMQDPARGMTMIVIPGLPPRDPRDLSAFQRRPGKVAAFFSKFIDFTVAPEQKHESTSYLGEVSCMDLIMMCLKKENVVKTVVLYQEAGSLYLQVQRRMPYWSVPCLIFAGVSSAFLPALSQRVYRSRPAVDGWYATSAVWASLAELLVVSVLLLACLIRYRGAALEPMKSLFTTPITARSNLLLLGFIGADALRSLARSFTETAQARGPATALSTSHTLLLLVALLATSRTVPIIITIISAAFSIVGAIVATMTLPGWSDWDAGDGAIAGASVGIVLAVYLSLGHLVTANQPTVGLLWMCKAVSTLVMMMFVAVRSGGSGFFSEDFMGGSDAVWPMFVLACVAVLAQGFLLKALKAIHALPVSMALLVGVVLGIVFLHWCIPNSDGDFGELDRKHILTGVCLTILGLCIACGIAVSEGRYSEVDLTCPELTRKTARPPQKLTVTSLRHHIRQTKSEPPMVWNYAPPERIPDASFDTCPGRARPDLSSSRDHSPAGALR
eukprot:TRINITY_DN11067_c0_g1_i1.p1 TRINITY_DN11067_c0_g1~~TRINITY_DN11067_c0_g1_i1.p1  ORF type:complete len:750 (+),score=230.90 TRINITY_DN11067_c0_g1_i1:81-2330(+)